MKKTWKSGLIAEIGDLIMATDIKDANDSYKDPRCPFCKSELWGSSHVYGVDHLNQPKSQAYFSSKCGLGVGYTGYQSWEIYHLCKKIKPTEVASEHVCHCDISVLMARGCQCGGR